MIHIDPASPTFESLPRHEQALILANACNWSIEALMDEYGVSKHTVRLWIVPGLYERRLEEKRAYRKSQAGQAKALGRYARLRAQRATLRQQRGKQV
jgi:hypothetical protein